MHPWHKRDPQRFAIEVELMAKKSKARLYENGTQLYWLETLLSETRKLYRVKIEYPIQFPHERPKAFIISPTITSAPHRFSDGMLCLFGSSADAVKTTALVVRNRAIVWIFAYELWAATGEWMAPQH